MQQKHRFTQRPGKGLQELGLVECARDGRDATLESLLNTYSLLPQVSPRHLRTCRLQKRDPCSCVVDMHAAVMQELCARMRKQGAASVSVVTLLDKVARRVVDLKPDYRGFEVGSSACHTPPCAEHALPHANNFCQACSREDCIVRAVLTRHIGAVLPMLYALPDVFWVFDGI